MKTILGIFKDPAVLSAVGVVAIFLVGIFLAKSKINALIRKFIPEGVAFADTLDTESRHKLVRAVTYVENIVLSVVPSILKPVVDYLINPVYIVEQIERYLTSKKKVEMESVEKLHQ